VATLLVLHYFMQSEGCATLPENWHHSVRDEVVAWVSEHSIQNNNVAPGNGLVSKYCRYYISATWSCRLSSFTSWKRQQSRRSKSRSIILYQPT